MWTGVITQDACPGGPEFKSRRTKKYYRGAVLCTRGAHLGRGGVCRWDPPPLPRESLEGGGAPPQTLRPLALPQRHSHTPTPAPTAFPTANNRPPTAVASPVTARQSLWNSPVRPPPLQAKPYPPSPTLAWGWDVRLERLSCRRPSPAAADEGDGRTQARGAASRPDCPRPTNRRLVYGQTLTSPRAFHPTPPPPKRPPPPPLCTSSPAEPKGLRMTVRWGAASARVSSPPPKERRCVPGLPRALPRATDPPPAPPSPVFLRRRSSRSRRPVRTSRPRSTSQRTPPRRTARG